LCKIFWNWVRLQKMPDGIVRGEGPGSTVANDNYGESVPPSPVRGDMLKAGSAVVVIC
jgi:hypothetical protein